MVMINHNPREGRFRVDSYDNTDGSRMQSTGSVAIHHF